MKKVRGPLGLLLGMCAAVQVGTTGAHELPLGDGKIASAPRAGYVFACQTRFRQPGHGAEVVGAWLNTVAHTWNPDLKPAVDGSVTWPSDITITVAGSQRVITGNNLPSHPTGGFPIARTDDAYKYDRNPNSIAEQNVLLRLPKDPVVAKTPSCVTQGMIGFTLTGAALYNALDAGGQDAPAHEIQDSCDGHPQQQGQYHYHNWSDCFADTRSGPGRHSDLVGYALDGFGIYGKYGTKQEELHSSDLDACHGHIGPVLWDGKVVTMYHYHFTEDYPYSIGCFVGEVSAAAAHRGPGNGQLPPGARRPPPPGGGFRPPGN